jgi:hypothetical protein
MAVSRLFVHEGHEGHEEEGEEIDPQMTQICTDFRIAFAFLFPDFPCFSSAKICEICG